MRVSDRVRPASAKRSPSCFAQLAPTDLGSCLVIERAERWRIVSPRNGWKSGVIGGMIATAFGPGRWRDAVGLEPAEKCEVAMSDLDMKREEIAAQIARALGLDGLASLSPSDRATVDQRTKVAIEGYDSASPMAADGADADREMRRLLAEYHGLQQIQADQDNVRLAEEGEVFAPEDDA